MRQVSIYILSNDYRVKISTNGIQLQATLHNFMDLKVAEGPKTFFFDNTIEDEEILVEQIINNNKNILERTEPSAWSTYPTIVERQGPPPPLPPIIKEYKVEGRVADKDSKEPIQGIKVSITTMLPNDEEPPQEEEVEFSTKTDEKGFYALTFKIGTEEVSPDIFSVLKTPSISFESEDNKYGTETKKPYAGDNSLRTVKSSLDIIQMKPFVKDLQQETTKFQNVASEEVNKLKGMVPKDPMQALQKAVMKKIKDIIMKFIPLIIGLIAKFGISKLTDAFKKKFSNFNKKSCPNPDELKEIIRKRNKVVRILNAIYKFVDALVKAAGIVLTLIQIFRLVKNIVVNLPIPQAVGTPPAKDFGGLIASQPMSATLKSASNLDKFEKLIAKYEGLTIMILAILTVLKAVLKMALDLLKGLDGLIQTCAADLDDVELEQLNEELAEIAKEEEEEEGPVDPFINGFELSVISEPNKDGGKILRRRAIARNKDGVILLKGELSYSASDQILIDELKFYITQNDLKAY